jgi:hypothetical protein
MGVSVFEPQNHPTRQFIGFAMFGPQISAARVWRESEATHDVIMEGRQGEATS